MPRNRQLSVTINEVRTVTKRSGPFMADTDALSAALAVGQSRTSATVFLGDMRSGDDRWPELTLGPMKVDIDHPPETLLALSVTNSGHENRRDLEDALERAADALIDAGLKYLKGDPHQPAPGAVPPTMAKQPSSAVAAAVIGIALELGGLVLKAASKAGIGLLFADCDGVVVGDLVHLQAEDIRSAAVGGQSTYVRRYPGSTSPSGCGANSVYELTWSITANPDGPLGDHLYTASEPEVQSAQRDHGYTLEGVACQVISRANAETVSLHRLLNTNNGDHFYTVRDDERDAVLRSSVWKDEHEAGYVYPQAAAGAVPMYRLYHPVSGDHFYTTSAAERASAVARAGYRYEAEAFYVPGAPSSDTHDFYRLYRG